MSCILVDLPFEFFPCYLHCFLVTPLPVTLSLVLVAPVQKEVILKFIERQSVF